VRKIHFRDDISPSQHPSSLRPFAQPQRIRDSSVTIGPEWQMLEEITFSRLQKLSLPVEQPEDLSMHGTIYAYDKAYDAVNTRNDKPLQTIDMVKYNTTTSEDPIILDVSSKWSSGPLAFFDLTYLWPTLPQLAQKDQATVFTTDAILSVLMCAPRSVNSWDIVITKENGKLYLDKREGGVFGKSVYMARWLRGILM
jgi:translation initiation factor 3 subunit D